MSWTLIVSTLLVVAGPQLGVAQFERTLSTSPRSVELAHQFSSIRGVFELADGRVVVVDDEDRTIQIVDFRSGRSAELGRQGSGPGEYRSPSLIFALGGDSAGVLDDTDGRLLVITKEGHVGGLIAREALRAPGVASVFPKFGDGHGWFYGETRTLGTALQGIPVPMDSAAIIRWAVSGGAVEVIGRVFRPRPPGTTGSGSLVVSAGQAAQALETRDLWTVAENGRVAIVHHSPYRVDFVSPSAQLQRGIPIHYESVTINDSIKRAYIAERSTAAGVLLDRATGSKIIVRRENAGREPTSWPTVVPPFRSTAFVGFASNGVLWIQRTTVGTEGARYDLLGPSGNVVDRVRLPKGQWLVGFGRGTMYTARRNIDDLQFLQRRLLPVP